MNRSAEQVRDEWLVLRAQDGDRAGLDELIRRFQPRLLRHALNIIGSEQSAADIVQDSWIAIARGIRRVDDPAAFCAWAYRIVTNKCADHVRSLSRERQILNDQPMPVFAVVANEDGSLREAMAHLDPDQRAILSLRYFEDMSTRDLALVLGVPQGTVKSRLHQAREELKSLLERTTS